MNPPAVELLLAINSLFPVSPNLKEIHQAKGSVDGYQAWERQELTRVAESFGPFWDFAGKDVLDLGCGLGGKTVAYAQMGAASVTGLDLRSHSLRAADEENRQHNPDPAKVRFCLSDAAAMAFADASFDVIVSVNVLEHVDDLYFTLRECKRVLRPGGVMLFHFPPFYSPWGAHLEGWINFPWPHVFFSDQTLIEAARRIEEEQRRNTAYIPTAQVKWSELNRLPELNRVTAQQFAHLLDALDLRVLRQEMLPLGYHYFARSGPFHSQILGFLRKLAWTPVARELVTTKMSWVLGHPPRQQTTTP
ncbi:MAG: class I SAM-dependent methyltransferase [Caldilineaceae bacterium]